MSITIKELKIQLGPFVMNEKRATLEASKEYAKGVKKRLPKLSGELKEAAKGTADGVAIVGNHSTSGISNQQLAQIRGGKGVFTPTASDDKSAEKATSKEIDRQIRNRQLRF